MKKQFRAALFDLDGVVFDTEPQYSLFWGDVCRHYHPEQPGLEHIIKGQTLFQIFDRWFSGPLAAEQQSIKARLDDFERQMTYDYVPGFEAFVGQLRCRGIKTAVVTSSNMAKMNSVYAQRPTFQQLFDDVLTSEDFMQSKPAPDCYLEAARRFGLQPDECVVFEDSVNGLKSGRAAGMTVVALTTTNPPEIVTPLSDLQIPDYVGQERLLD